jgi:hypothetical protein
MEGKQMSAENQAGRRKSERKAKRAAPAESRAGQLMPSYESYHQITMLIIRGDVPEFEPGPLAKTLLLALEMGGDTMDDATHADILRVAACLQRRVIDEHNSDMQARAIIKKARAK